MTDFHTELRALLEKHKDEFARKAKNAFGVIGSGNIPRAEDGFRFTYAIRTHRPTKKETKE